MSDTPEAVERAVRERFAALALHPERESRFPIGSDSARQLGYDPHSLAALPPAASESFAGVGNPFALGVLPPGCAVLDFGCGAGLDCLLAAKQVTPGGRVIGVDLAEEMLAKARLNAIDAKLANIEFRLGRGDAVPVASASVDVVLSNGVLNLCVNKPAVVAEWFRVLRPGGRLQMADILLEPSGSLEQPCSPGTWSD